VSLPTSVTAGGGRCYYWHYCGDCSSKSHGCPSEC
jgi:hypothetical protein